MKSRLKQLGELISRIRKTNAGKNAAASYLAFISTFAWAFISIPVAVHFLDKDEIGTWAIVNALLTYLTWMDLGIGQATGRLIADSVTNRDQVELNRWWSATRFVLWVQGALVMVLGLVMSNLAIDFFKIHPDHVSSTKVLLVGGSIVTGLSFPFRGAVGLLTAQNRYYWAPLVQAVCPWINLVVFYLMLRSGYGLKSYIVGLGFSQIFTWIAFTLLVRSSSDRPRWDARGIAKKRLGKLFALSGNMAMVGLVGSVITSLPNILVGKLGSVGLVPTYNFSSKGPQLGGNLIAKIYYSFYPGLQRLHISGLEDDFRERFQAIGLMTIACGLVGSAIVLLANPTLVHLLAKNKYYAGSETNLWLAVGVITIPMSGLFQILLPISGAMGKLPILSGLKLILGIATSVTLWPRFGVTGIASTFALLPAIDGIYCYMRGASNCGYRPHDLGGKIAACTGLAMLLVISTYFLSIIPTAKGSNFELAGKTLFIPSAASAISPAILAMLGLSGCILAMRRLGSVRLAR